MFRCKEVNDDGDLWEDAQKLARMKSSVSGLGFRVSDACIYIHEKCMKGSIVV